MQFQLLLEVRRSGVGIVALPDGAVWVAEGLEERFNPSPLLDLLHHLGIRGAEDRLFGAAIDQNVRLATLHSRLQRIPVFPLCPG